MGKPCGNQGTIKVRSERFGRCMVNTHFAFDKINPYDAASQNSFTFVFRAFSLFDKATQ